MCSAYHPMCTLLILGLLKHRFLEWLIVLFRMIGVVTLLVLPNRTILQQPLLGGQFHSYDTIKKLTSLKNGDITYLSDYTPKLLYSSYFFICTCLLVFLLFPHFITEVNSLGKIQIFSNLSCFRDVESGASQQI